MWEGGTRKKGTTREWIRSPTGPNLETFLRVLGQHFIPGKGVCNMLPFIQETMALKSSEDVAGKANGEGRRNST